MTWKGRTAGTVAATAALALAATLMLGPAALAQGAASIDGTVTNGTEDAPAAGVDVSLQLFSATGDLGVLDGTTDDEGRFSFDQLPPSLAGYQVFATFGGAEYRGVAQAYAAGTPTNADLTVFDTTSDPADVTYSNYVVWVDRLDEGYAVQHGLGFSNAGTTAYVGDGETVVTIDLPPDATNPQFLDTFLEYPGDIVEGTYVSTAPIVPGESSATLRYETGTLPSVSVPLEFPTTSFQLYVPDGIDVGSKILRFEGSISDQGQTYNLYSAQNLAPNTTIEASLTPGAGDGSPRTALLILLGAAALFAAGVLLAWALRRRRGSRAPARPAKAKPVAVKPAPAPAAASGNGHRDAAPDEDPDLIIDEIAALDLSFEKGLLDERRYQRLRVAAKDRLLRAQGGARAGGSGR